MMTSQPGRNHSSPERRIRRDVDPPAPGQAYFGYPQPSRTPFPVQQPNRGQLPVQQPVQAEPRHQSDWPTQPTPAVPLPVLTAQGPDPTRTNPPIWPVPRPQSTADQRPYRAHRTATRSRIWIHLIGYALTLAFGLELGIAVMRLR